MNVDSDADSDADQIKAAEQKNHRDTENTEQSSEVRTESNPF